MISTRHEQGYHAAQRCQAASLSLTALRWRGLFWACQVESPKNVGFLALLEGDQHEQGPLGRSACMLLLCMLKGSRLIAAPIGPQGKDDPDPDIGKRPHGDGMAFAFSPFALVVIFGPGFTLRRLPGELMKRVTQRFDATQSAMCFGVHPALIEHRRGSSQSLQTPGRLVAFAIIADFCQQSRSQTFACTR